MRRKLHETWTRLAPGAVVLALFLALPAGAKAPGKKDPEKLAQKAGKAASSRDWDDLAEYCAQGLDLVERGSEWDQAWGRRIRHSRGRTRGACRRYHNPSEQ